MQGLGTVYIVAVMSDGWQDSRNFELFYTGHQTNAIKVIVVEQFGKTIIFLASMYENASSIGAC